LNFVNNDLVEKPMAAPYKRPPITEAIIEIRTSTELQSSALERLVARFSRKYPAPAQKLFEVSVEVKEPEPTVTKQSLAGYRLASLDGTKVLNVAPRYLGTAHLAPYEGWERLYEEARANWEIWLKITGWQPVARIGVRYINRIDIPGSQMFNLGDYLTFRPSLPTSINSAIGQFAMNALIPLGVDELKVVLNAGSTQSPLINHASLLLDLDISRDSDLPKDEAGLWDLINRIRVRKNEVFESCITSKTRALFS
jgi:uncharacterized protein (TIGR04255 family)